jgi:hypothetical protein
LYQQKICFRSSNEFDLYILAEKGLQIRWEPKKDIQTHFIEVVFSNQSKSDGGPIRTHKIYQHLGVAEVFYQNSDSKKKNLLNKR